MSPTGAIGAHPLIRRLSTSRTRALPPTYGTLLLLLVLVSAHHMVSICIIDSLIISPTGAIDADSISFDDFRRREKERRHQPMVR